MLTYQSEHYESVIDDIRPLLYQHWREIAVYPDIELDPDYAFYNAADKAGVLQIYTVRDDAALVGYAIFVLRKGHAHYQRTGWAMNDIVWLHPEHRRLGVGKALCDFWESDIRSRGISVVHVNSKVAHPALEMLLLACGYAQIEKGFEKRLD